jgi:hypothetical protein
MDRASASPLARPLLVGQGVYYLATGIWPLVDVGSFQRVTGPKTDVWLVRTVGALVSVMGASMLVAARRAAPSAESVLLSAGGAAALAAVDVAYVAVGCIARVYLVDAALQAVLMLGWAAGGRRARA